MFGLFKSLNNKTQIMMANAAMKAGHLALNKSPTPPDVLQTHTLLQLDLLCTQNGIPSIVELHEKQGRKEPSYYNGGCGGLAHTVSNHYGRSNNPAEIFMASVATAYFSILATPPMTGGRKAAWENLLDLLDLE